MTDLKEMIEREISGFLDWPGDNKSIVTTTSAKLFAEHVARLYADHFRGAEKMAASAVQGEPVGEAGSLPGTSGFTTAVFESRKVPVGTNLYATPQPAEQNPSAGDSLTSVPDEVLAAEFAAWWDEHGQFCRAGGGTYEQSFAFEAWRHLYPQLMNLQMAAAEPDVSRLVEALVACAKASSAAEVGLIVDAALAAHRKGGEA